MQNAPCVGIGERVGDLAGEPYRLLDGKLGLAVEPDPERLALDEGHGIPEPAGGLARVEQWEDVGMDQLGGEPDLAVEALGPHQGAQLGAEDLERDEPAVAKIPGEIHHRHSAGAELALDIVAVLEGARQRTRHISHVGDLGGDSSNLQETPG